MDRLELAQKEAELLEAGIPYAAVTLVESAGTARTEGKMLVLSENVIYGTIGGGAGEQLARRDALSLLAEGNNAVHHYELDSPLSAEGKACGGSLTVFIESCRSTRPQLVMVGGGHVGLALLRAARLAGFATTLLDTRGEDQIGDAMAAADRFIPLDNFGPALAEVSLPAGAYYVVATFSHATDGEALGGVLHHRGLLLGLSFAKIFNLNYKKATAVAIEVGMQNSGLAISLATSNFAANPLATLPGAIFSVWHNISGSVFASIRRRGAKNANEYIEVKEREFN